MKTFRINYIDGHDLRYKSVEVPAKNEEDALSALWDMYDADFDHQIIEVLPQKKTSANKYMRIGGVEITTPPFTKESRQMLEAGYVQ